MNRADCKDASAILDPLYERALEISGVDNWRAGMEAARLASLNLVLQNTLIVNELYFKRLSHIAKQYLVDEETVFDILDTLLESDIPLDIQYNPKALAPVLGEIHLSATHSLSTKGSAKFSQRDFGGFYTPDKISDYIAEITIGPLFESIVEEISVKGLEALSKFGELCGLDPACGTGAFFVSAIKTLMSRKNRINREIEKAQLSSEVSFSKILQTFLINLHGVDLDPAALDIAALSISVFGEQGPLSLSKELLKTNLKEGNSLISPPQRYVPSELSAIPSWKPFDFFEEYQSVFDRTPPGFDFILMNPPYQRLKPNLAEYMRDRLLTGDREIHLDGYEEYRSQLLELISYFKESRDFKLGNKYTIDMYRLFIERTLKLVNETGRIGFIVPSTILGDVSSSPLRRELLLNNTVETIVEFPEGARVFPNVTQSVCIMILTKLEKTKSITAHFGLYDLDALEQQKATIIPLSRIIDSMGSSMVVPRVDNEGWRILKKMHKFPPLGSIENLEIRRGELDLTIHKEHITPEKTKWQLLRGFHIGRYSLREDTSKPEEYVDIESFLKDKTSPRYKKHPFIDRIACQQVSNMAQRWRLKFSAIQSGIILANSCNYITSNDTDWSAYLLGLLNSDLLNWRFRVSNSNNHVSTRELFDLPIPTKPILRSYDGDIFQGFKEKLSKQKQDEFYIPDVEAQVFRIYGLTKKEIRYVLRSQNASSLEIDQVLTELS